MNAREELEIEDSGRYGDPRRCPRHPQVKTSSPDGLHDGLCGICEAEADDGPEKKLQPKDIIRPRIDAVCDSWVPTRSRKEATVQRLQIGKRAARLERILRAAEWTAKRLEEA